MPDEGKKLPPNRIHLFGPVSRIISDGYAVYETSGVHRTREIKCYDGSPETNTSGGLTSYDYSEHNKDNSCDPIVDTFHSQVGFREIEIPMYTAISRRNGSYDDFNVQKPNGGVLRLGIDVKAEDEYDVTLNSRSTIRASPVPLNPLLDPNQIQKQKQHHDGAMSTNSRTQAIARGQKELMDMVRDLPETLYELSLKDIVERKAADVEIDPPLQIPTKQVEEEEEEEEKRDKKPSHKVKNTHKKKTMPRSKSGDHGNFLLKTSVFPILLGSKKSKRSLVGSGSGSGSSSSSGSFKIASLPKPQSTPTRSRISSESDHSNGLSSSTSSTSSSTSTCSNTSSDNQRHSSRFLPSCCFFKGRNRRSIKHKK